MKFNRIVLVSIILLIFSIGAVNAADENMTDTADEVLSAEPVEDLEAAQPGTFSELSTLVSNTSSGETLYLEKDYVNSKSSGKVIISKKITIDGQGHTIDANNKSNIFSVSNNKVVLKNINFINSYTKNYSAVYGTCTIINCTFTDCLSEKNGGAIYNATAYNSSFINCKAGLKTEVYPWIEDDDELYPGNLELWYEEIPPYCQGGAIFNGDAYNCYFDNCYAEFFYIYEYEFSMDIHETIRDSGSGGAISNGNAYNSIFTNCRSGRGGAIYNGDANNCSFIKCLVSNRAYANSYGWVYGGAIYNGDANNCSFINCSAINGDGGAIYIGDANGCSFTDCYAKWYGGAIYQGNAYDSTFINCTSRDNNFIFLGNYTNCAIIPFTFSCSNLTVDYGEGAILPIRTVEDSNGVEINIKIYKGNKLINSFASTTGSDLPIDAAPGNYIISLTSEYADPLNVSLTVNKGSPKLALANDFAKSGETANVKVTMSKKANGFVKITINGKTYRVQISSGVASVDVPNLADGSYSVSVTYAGNTYHTAETITDTFHVGKFTQGMELVTKNIKVGETERLTANMAKDTTGFVRFIIGDETYKVKIENGVAYTDLDNLKAGTYSVTLKYAGNYKYNAESITKTFTVSKSSPGIKVTAQDIKVGEIAVIKVSLASDAPGNVWITVNGESCKVKISNGMATLNLSDLKAGTYDVSVKYNGNYKYNAQTVSKTFTASKSSPGLNIRANNIDFGVKDIIANLANDATGNISITVNGESYNVKINNGVATLRLSGLEEGTYDVKVKYAGDDKYTAQTKSRTVTVKKVVPTLSVSAKTANGKTTITAKINNDAPGNLKITLDGTTYTAKITNGVASIILDNPISGSHTVTVGYDGSDKYETATITKTITI